MQFNHAKRLRHVIVLVVGVAVAVAAAVIGVQQGRTGGLRLVEGQSRPVTPTVVPTPTTGPVTVAAGPGATPATTVRTPVGPTTIRPLTPTTVVVPAGRTTTTVAPPPHVTTFAMSPASGPTGSEFTAAGAGCTSGGVTVTLLPLVGSLPLDINGVGSRPDGRWSVRLAVPPLALPGRYPVFAHCGGGGLLNAFDYQIQTFVVELPG